MLTINRASPIEFEHPNTKLKNIEHDNVNFIFAASGSSSLIDEFFERIETTIEGNYEINKDGDTIEDIKRVKNLANIARNCMNNMVVDAINNEVLAQFNTSLDELKSEEAGLKAEVSQQFLNEASEKRKDILNNISILMAGVDEQGAQLFKLKAGQKIPMNSLGYAAIGSGMQPAQSEFINNKHNNSSNLEIALQTITAAKMRAENAQGVGQDTDMYIITKDKKTEVTDEQINELRQIEKKIKEEQSEAKQQVLNNSDFDYGLEEFEK
jgi:hypothetical protein